MPPSLGEGVWFAIERPEPMRIKSGIGWRGIVTSATSFAGTLDNDETPDGHVGFWPSVRMARRRASEYA